MKYMLDTNTCIYIIKNKPPQVFEKFEQTKVGDICISSITLSELWAGVEKSAYPKKNTAALDKFLNFIEVANYGREAAVSYGKIRAALEKAGTPIGAYDMMIAAHAIASGLILVTNNMKEFGRIENLKLENWV